MISVIMPTYNCAQYISQAAQSILNQTYTNYEMLIINDGSTDETGKIINKIKDRRVRCINKEHTGLSDTLNYGLKKAQNNIIAIMHSDDISTPRRLAKQIETLESNGNDNLVISSWYGVFRSCKLNYVIKLPVNHKEIVQALNVHSSICHPCTMYNRKIILDSGGYEGRDGIEDYLLWLKIKSKVQFYNIPEVLLYYRDRDDSLSRQNVLAHKSKILHAYRENPIAAASKKEIQKKVEMEGWRYFNVFDQKRAVSLWTGQKRLLLKPKISAAVILGLLPVTWREKVLHNKIHLRFLALLNLKYYRFRKDFINIHKKSL